MLKDVKLITEGSLWTGMCPVSISMVKQKYIICKNILYAPQILKSPRLISFDFLSFVLRLSLILLLEVLERERYLTDSDSAYELKLEELIQ